MSVTESGPEEVGFYRQKRAEEKRNKERRVDWSLESYFSSKARTGKQHNKKY